MNENKDMCACGEKPIMECMNACDYLTRAQKRMPDVVKKLLWLNDQIDKHTNLAEGYKAEQEKIMKQI